MTTPNASGPATPGEGLLRLLGDAQAMELVGAKATIAQLNKELAAARAMSDKLTYHIGKKFIGLCLAIAWLAMWIGVFIGVIQYAVDFKVFWLLVMLPMVLLFVLFSAFYGSYLLGKYIGRWRTHER